MIVGKEKRSGASSAKNEGSEKPVRGKKRIAIPAFPLPHVFSARHMVAISIISRVFLLSSLQSSGFGVTDRSSLLRCVFLSGVLFLSLTLVRHTIANAQHLSFCYFLSHSI